MKFATLKINGCYRAVIAYDDSTVTGDDFTKGGQRIELSLNHRLVAIAYGRISHTDLNDKVSDTIIELAE